MGAEGGHLKLELIEETNPGWHISAIGFNMSESFDYIRGGNPFDICYSIVENYYRGTSTMQLRIKDIHRRDDEI